MITYTNGRAIEHLHYLPYGETQVDQRATSYAARYTFSAKEKDEETGYSYFGARYYSSDLSIWLSVDPMSDKYPSLSPYVYCANNPVKLVDPNGERVMAFNNDKMTKCYIKQYIKRLFGTFIMFRFNLYGELKINKIAFDIVYNKASDNQKMLLKGMENAIKNKTTMAKIQICDNCSTMNFLESEFITDDYGNSVFTGDKKGTSSMNLSYLGGGGTTYSKSLKAYVIGISDNISNKAYYSSENDRCARGDASAVFIHELLDEFLNTDVLKNVTQASNQSEKVQYQNVALKILHLPTRTGTDHEN